VTRECYEEGMGALLESHGIIWFTARELCPVGRSNAGVILEAPPAKLWKNIVPTVKIAQEAREHFGEAMIVTSGYRDQAYNRAVGSSSRRHVDFFALDVRLAGTPTRQLFDWLDRHPQAGRLGLGYYPTFVHVDTMGTRARW
jgi:uncharacterized protein YcbK (DUF882 family)